MRWKTKFFALAIGLAAGLAQSAPDVKDTRLVSQPAVSAKNIAFVYDEDLWMANLDGSNPKRLTTDAGVESNPMATGLPLARSTMATPMCICCRYQAGHLKG